MMEALLIAALVLLTLNTGLIFRLDKTLQEELAKNRAELNKNAREAREEANLAMKNFGDSVLARMTENATLQKNQLDTFSAQLIRLTGTNNDNLEKMTQTIEKHLTALQNDNNLKLEKMRETVDEKLHKTLEQRLGESFKLVSERLELVQKGLGEMQTLATGVGDLKKVLSNVKTRGILGEVQLGNILEQILTPEQYAKNVITKKGGRENVEFAIKLPGKDDTDACVYLPLDSKFPLEGYYSLEEAYEKGDPALIEAAVKQLEGSIKKNARDVRDKYIDPPNTTDFAIMFLPTEGLYAEIVRRTSLIEILQRDYKVNIAGPSTLAAFLSSLQMGFQTLAIEKRSSEVWNVLGAVKTEFEKFGEVLNKAQEKINQASQEIDQLVGARTRQIQRKLKSIQSLTPEEAAQYIAEEPVENEKPVKPPLNYRNTDTVNYE